MPQELLPKSISQKQDVHFQERFVLLGVYAACALMFALLHYRESVYHLAAANGMDTNWLRLIGFSGDRPYQYRILMFALTHLLHFGLRLPVPLSFELLEAGFLFLLFVAFRRYLAAFIPDRIARFATLALIYPLVWNYVLLGSIYWPYDIPGIFFFVAGLVCLREKRWDLFYPIFLLATLNRETSCFLILAFVLIAWGRQRPVQIVGHVCAQALLWIAIKLLIARLFVHNPGTFTDNMMHNNWLLLTRFLHGNLTFIRFLLLVCGAAWLPIPLAWQRQPVMLKRLLWIVPLFVVGMGVVGVLDEVRIYNELIPILLAPALFSLYVIFSSDKSARLPETLLQ